MREVDFTQALIETVNHINKNGAKYTHAHTAEEMIEFERLHMTLNHVCALNCPFCQVDRDAEIYLKRLMRGELQ